MFKSFIYLQLVVVFLFLFFFLHVTIQKFEERDRHNKQEIMNMYNVLTSLSTYGIRRLSVEWTQFELFVFSFYLSDKLEAILCICLWNLVDTTHWCKRRNTQQTSLIYVEVLAIVYIFFFISSGIVAAVVVFAPFLLYCQQCATRFIVVFCFSFLSLSLCLVFMFSLEFVLCYYNYFFCQW